MKFLAFYLVLFCGVVFLHQQCFYTEASYFSTHSDCEFDLVVECIASCSLASSCWGIANDVGYIHCTWNTTDRLQHAATIVAGSNHCSPQVTCSSTNRGRNGQGYCHSSIFYNDSNCAFLGSTISQTVTFSILTTNGDSKQCTTFSKFNPCYIIKLDPPLIENITETTKLNIVVQKPICLEHSLSSVKFKLIYSTFNGIVHSPPSIRSALPFLIPLYEATNYSISVFVAVDEVPDLLQIWSEPAQRSYLTSPTDAVDNGFIGFQCTVNQSSPGLIASWQKKGIVDAFKCELEDENTGSVSTLSLGRETTSQTVFRAVFDSIQPKHNYVITITAQNEKGNSHPTTTDVDCASSENYPHDCKVVSDQPDLITVQWIAPQVTTSFNSFRIITRSSEPVLVSARLPANTLHYDVTNLQTCILYEIEVKSMFDSVEVGSCTLQSYTKETEPRQAPDFKIFNISMAALSLQVESVNQSCGDITLYEVVMSSADFTWTSSYDSCHITIIDLNPFTFYNLTVAVINLAGKGPMSSPVPLTTAQAAPSDPPELLPLVKKTQNLYGVEWKEPEVMNGVLHNYILFINHTNMKKHSDDELGTTCSTFLFHTQCDFPGNMRSTEVELVAGDVIALSACTDEGSKCSGSSPPITISISSDGFRSSMYVVLAISIVVFLMALAGCGYVIRSRRHKVATPMIHPQVLTHFSSHSSEQVRGDSSDDQFPLCCDDERAQLELYDSISEWRDSVKDPRRYSVTNPDVDRGVSASVEAATSRYLVSGDAQPGLDQSRTKRGYQNEHTAQHDNAQLNDEGDQTSPSTGFPSPCTDSTDSGISSVIIFPDTNDQASSSDS